MMMENQDENSNADCQQLLKRLQNIGIFVENGNEIFKLITNLEETVEHLKKELEGVYEKKKNSDKEIHSLMLQDVENRRKISDLEDEIRSHKNKEPLYQSSSLRRTLTDHTQLKSITEGLEKERDTLKKKNIELEQKAVDFFNTKLLWKETELKLKEENINLRKQLDGQIYTEQTQNSEIVLKDGKPDIDKLTDPGEKPVEQFTILRKELESVRKENKRLKEMNADFRDEIVSLKDTQEVVMKQKDAEYSLRVDQIDTLKREKTGLIDQLEEKVKEIHDLKEESTKNDPKLFRDYEQLQISYKYLEDELKNLNIQVDLLRGQRERLKLERDTLDKEVENKNLIIEENQRTKEAQEAVAAEAGAQKYGNSLDVTITKVDVGGKEKRFGVKMMSKPSRVVITEVVEKQTEIKPGDYVIKINDMNVQNSDMKDDFRDLGNLDFLNMTLVRPRDCFQEYNVKDQSNCVDAKLSLVVTKLSSAAKRANIRLGDEIVKINGFDVSTLPFSKIQHKLAKHSVKLSVRRTIDEVEWISSTPSATYESIDNVGEISIGSNLTRYKSRSAVSSSKASSISASSSSPDDDDSSFRRSATAATDISRAFKNSVTSPDIVVGDKILIRNNDTDDSGDSSVIREQERQGSNEPDYVFMGNPPVDEHHHLSTIPETSLPAQNGETRSDSSSSTKHDEVASECSPVIARPPHPLPDNTHSNSGAYHYVNQKFSDIRGYQRTITLRKNVSVPSFGFTIFGGNKVGIYVDHVKEWEPAEQEGLQEGSRIISMNGVDVTGSVFCFAAEYIRKLSNTDMLKMIVMNMPEKDIAAIRSKVPYDWFSVKARKDHPHVPGCTLPFKKGDVLQIKDSYYDFDPNTGGYKWFAVKAIGGGVYSQMREGSVPAEQSSVYKMNEDYPEEEFDNVTDSKKKKKLSFLKPWMKKSESSDKYEENSVFPHEELYEYLDDVKI
ncbi:uncharacterized protein LOC135689374 isoform X1 [Rhopilema esculentum]|uniref:uncharacterized protein LOC135689374 isoform X1 n=1 Tax=Rhopilema esculentum TaxID=499914 RepID=UPI0031D20467